MAIKTFSLFAILLLNATGGAARIPAMSLPANLPDGHYVGDGTIDPKTGFLRYTYVGAIDHDTVANYTATTAGESGAALDRRLTVNCDGRSAGDSVDSVQNAFASYWGGKTFNNYWLRTTQGSSQAYACNYDGLTLTLSGGDYLSEMGSVNSVCGKGRAGWYDNGGGRYRLGRDGINAPFCP